MTFYSEDAFRTDFKDLVYVLSQVSDKTSRFALPDTVGGANPFEVYQRIKDIKQVFPNHTFVFHGHNDNGMAAANYYAAYKAGCTSFSTSTLGLGERCGIASEADVIAALYKEFGE